MSKFISRLWNGDIEPIRKLGVNNSEIKNLEELLKRNYEKLIEGLGEEQKILFEKYNDCINEYITLISEQAFNDGYCIATKMTSEALHNVEEIV